MERSPRSADRRRFLIPLALVGWLAIVMVGAGRDEGQGPLLGVRNLNNVLIVAWLVVSLIGLVLLVILNPFQREWNEPARSRWWGWGYLVILVLLILALQQDSLRNFLQPQDDTEAEAELSGQEGEADQVDDEPIETVAEATDLLLLVAAAGAMAGVWILLRRQTETGDAIDDEHDIETELLAAVEQAEVILAEGDDPRTAVLNAYAKLEQVMATRGPERRRAETTSEHVRRAMQTFGTESEAVVQLAELYELARFSELPITDQQRAGARAALDQARADLAMPA